MKATHLLAAMVVLAGLTPVGEAGLFDRVLCRKDGKRCDCDCVPACPPVCCKPVIVRPCRTVHTYQRQCSTLKPPCCDVCCPPRSSCTRCCPNQSACASTDCCKANGLGCCKSNGEGCCEMGCCEDPCCDGCCDACCPGSCCELAQLIYESQTGCYARHRKRAIHRLSNRYDCACYPEVMCALIYALNDADEHVRAKAADEIGDQLRKNPCCCSDKVVCALTCALADCHWAVRWQAKQALKQCGYQVVKPRKVGCCEMSCCEAGCCDTHCDASGDSTPATPNDLPAGESGAPAIQPSEAAPAAPTASVTKPTVRQASAASVSPARKSLAALFELFD